jgi:hypothetical protein
MPNSHGKAIQFGRRKHHRMCHAKETDLLVRYQRKSSTKTSTSTSKTSRDQQQMGVIILKMNNQNVKLPLVETPNLLRRYTTDTKSTSSSSKNRLLGRHKSQMTL